MTLKLDHITILNSDPDAAQAFYGALLPLLDFTEEKPGIWHDGAGFYFQLKAARPETSPYERYGAGVNHFGFQAPDADFVFGIHRSMAEAGFEVPEIQNLGGAVALFLKDPDGLRVEITYYPPGVAVVG